MLDKFKIRVIIAVWEYHIAMYTWWDKHQKNAYKHTMWRWHMWHSIECGKKSLDIDRQNVLPVKC